jgi:hypothetical protein
MIIFDLETGVKMAIMAQLGQIARSTTDPEVKAIIGAIFHKLRKSA